MNYIYGRHPVSEALRSGALTHIYVTNAVPDGRLKALLDEAAQAGIPVSQVGKAQLEQWVGNVVHQGVVAAAQKFSYVELDDMVSSAPQPNPLFVALDHVQDPHNFGSIIRSAFALGAHGLITTKDRACDVTGTVIKSSAGAVMHMPIARVTNLRRALEELKEAGLWVVGTVASGGQPLQSIDWNRGIVLVIGSEGEGLRRITVESCDMLAYIPMAGELGSLNAAVAAGISLYEARRNRS